MSISNLTSSIAVGEGVATPRPGDAGEPAWLRIVRRKVENLPYGVVSLVVHEGRIKQIESTEKIRVESVAGNAKAATLAGVRS